MTPKRISLKNFLSFGDPAVEFDFTTNEPLWVLCGPNGIGKSAVFDAITYSLYGNHRGGVNKPEQLIRHGANGFEVEFDFEFNGCDYRIRRTRPRKGRTTQYLLKQIAGEWACVRGNDPAGAVTGDDIKAWVIETLGLEYGAFTNSVLLRQGEAEKLFSASREDRIAVLKGIIGFEEFEALSGRVHTATTRHGQIADGFETQLRAILPVSDEELATAELAVSDADAALTACQHELTEAVERIGSARQWERLVQQCDGLRHQLEAANERHKQGRQIREDKLALDDLIAAVPMLNDVFALRTRITKLETDHLAANDSLATQTAERDTVAVAGEQSRQKAGQHQTRANFHGERSKQLEREIEHLSKFLNEADAIAALDVQLGEFSHDLDSHFAAALTDELHATQAERAAATARTRAETLLAQAVEKQEHFSAVGVGATCPHCGQIVTESYAGTVRAGHAAEVSSRSAELEQATTSAKFASERLAAAKMAARALEKSKNQRDQLAAQREFRQASLNLLSISNNAAELRVELSGKVEAKQSDDRIAAAEVDLATTASGDATRLETELAELERVVKFAQEQLRRLDTELAVARSQEASAHARLSDVWKERLPRTTAETVVELASNRDRLLAEGVVEKFQALEQDEARRNEWERLLADVEHEIGKIPASAQIPEADARQHHAAKKIAVETAAEQRESAARTWNELVARQQQREQLTKDSRISTEHHRLHKRLDTLLGEAGLHLQLTQDAQSQILGYANETLGHLSDNDLSLEEDPLPDSKKAFDLHVRIAGGEPIPVAFLSGSQRFRVAVSVALAVGRFASGRARPLESVIIDEGFGSLDKDGLRAMADELKRLQQLSSLRRVILVSHQDEFTEQFTVGYRLCKTPAGTTTRFFRR